MLQRRAWTTRSTREGGKGIAAADGAGRDEEKAAGVCSRASAQGQGEQRLSQCEHA